MTTQHLDPDADRLLLLDRLEKCIPDLDLDQQEVEWMRCPSRTGLTWLRRLAGDGQGSKSGCGEGGGCHQPRRRPWDGTATPFR